MSKAEILRKAVDDLWEIANVVDDFPIESRTLDLASEDIHKAIQRIRHVVGTQAPIPPKVVSLINESGLLRR